MNKSIMADKEKNITVELLKVFKSFADQLNVSADISKVLHGISDIKASGNEIESALRNILKELLPSKYNIGHGHIIDKHLQTSKQYDIVLTDKIDSKSIIKTKDGTELFLYETIYSIGEVKATWNLSNLKSTSESISDLKTRLTRKEIANTTIFSGSSEIHLSSPITSYPIRNPLFAFAFAIKSDNKLKDSVDILKNRSLWKFLPNIIIILNEGVFVLINAQKLRQNKLSINIYPEFVAEDKDYEWQFITSNSSGKNLSYLVFSLIEHQANCVLEQPSYLNYSVSLLGIGDDELLNLDEL